MSRFPKLTETFVLYELLAIAQQGIEVEIYPLLRARNTATHPEGASVWGKFWELLRPPAPNAPMHPEAAPLVARAHYTPLLSWAIVWANLLFLLTRPVRYFSALGTLLVANLGSLNFLAGGLVLFPKIAYLARRMRADDITHIHAHFANHPAAAAYLIHRLTDLPYSFTAHGADFQVDQHMLAIKARHAAFVVTISNCNREFLIPFGGAGARERIHVIRCGVDPEVFHPPTAAQRATRDPRLRIVCTGTLYEVKGQTYLIEACRQLRERHIDFRCDLIGDGPMREMLQRQVRAAQLDDHVRLLGRQTRQQIAEHLQSSDLLVAPSVPTRSGRREGIPVVLMEAMACGLAVVASDLSGIPELVEHDVTGVLCPPRDSAALAEAIESLSRDPARLRRLGQAAQRKVEREYHLDANAARLADLFVSGGRA